MASKRPWYILVCLGLLTYGIISPGDGTLARAAGEAPSLPAGLAAPSQRTPMPEFSVLGIDGTTLRSADLLGKVVVVRFWATW
jgi:hypothetical protein